MNTLGDVTKSIFLNEVEAHKLHLEFEVESTKTVKVGQLVELVPATEKIQPLTGDANLAAIGISIHDSAAGEMATVAMKGMAVIKGLSAGALNAGPVKWDSYDGTEKMNVFNQTTVTSVNTYGWSLTKTTGAGEEILVVVKH